MSNYQNFGACKTISMIGEVIWGKRRETPLRKEASLRKWRESKDLSWSLFKEQEKLCQKLYKDLITQKHKVGDHDHDRITCLEISKESPPPAWQYRTPQ